MEKLKTVFFILSFIFIFVGFGASIWLYVVLSDGMSMAIMVIFFLALVWYGFNVRTMLKKGK